MFLLACGNRGAEWMPGRFSRGWPIHKRAEFQIFGSRRTTYLPRNTVTRSSQYLGRRMPRVEPKDRVCSLIAISLEPKDYSDWVSRGGGSFRIVIPQDHHPLDGVSGLLLTGGQDVSPDRYGEPNRYCVRVNAERDDFEIGLLRTAFRQDLPVLAICRGMQLLVVALGGTILVNSHHHQGIRSLPNDLLIAARSLDGLIEAVESPARRFVLGLQWHPERWQDNSSARIMEAFLAACSEEIGRAS